MALLVSLICFILPGALIGLAVLKKTRLPLTAQAGFGALAGLSVPPMLMFAAGIVGIGYSMQLAAASVLALYFAAVILFTREKAWEQPLLKEYEDDPLEFLSGNLHVPILLAMIGFALWVAIQPGGLYMSEYDPYFYDRATQFIIQDGQVPLVDDLAWYPHYATHRERPLMHYYSAGLYSLGSLGAGFELDSFLGLANYYPPIALALTTLFAFLLVASEYGRKWGLVAAGSLVTIPIVLVKFSASLTEQQPWAVMVLLGALAAYAYFRKTRSLRVAAFAALFAAASILGSKQDIMLFLILSAFIGFDSLLTFLRDKKQEKRLLLGNAGLMASAIIAAGLQYAYSPSTFVLAGPAAISCAVLFSASLFAISVKVSDYKKKQQYLAGFLAVLFLLFLLSPLGGYAVTFVRQTTSFSTSQTLFSTIAEQEKLVNTVQYLGLVGYGIGQLHVYELFIISANVLLAAALLYKKPELALLYLALLLPLYALGTSAIKYSVFLGMAAAISLPIALAEIEGYVRSFIKEEEPREETASAGVTYAITQEGIAVPDLVAEVAPEPSAWLEWKPSILKALLALGMLFVIVPALMLSFGLLSMGQYQAESGQINCQMLQLDGRMLEHFAYCEKIGVQWVQLFSWMQSSTSEDAVFATWWDYGHWMNFLGQRKVVTRNDLAYPAMISEFAEALTANRSQDMIDYMQEHNATYLVVSSDFFGKWDRIAYLSCVSQGRTNRTFSANSSQFSDCEKELRFEYLTIPVSGLVESDYCEATGPYGSLLVKAKSSEDNTFYCVEPPPPQFNVDTSELLVLDEEGGDTKSSIVITNFYESNGRLYGIYLLLRGSSTSGEQPAYDSAFYNAAVLHRMPGFEIVLPEKPDGLAPIIVYKLEEP